MPSASRRPKLWHTLLIAAITLGLIWWLFRSVKPAEVWTAIERARLGLVALAVLVTLQTYLIRAWRWQALLSPLGKARFRTSFRTTVIGFTTTFLLPGRLGEVLRPYLLARAEGFNTAAALATVIIERVLDLICVLVLFAAFFLTAEVDVGPDVKAAGVAAAVLAVVAVVLLVVGAGHPERLGRWTAWICRLLPARAAEVVAGFVRTFAEGLAVMRRPAALFAALGLSLLLWLSIALGIWLSSLALHLTLAFTGTFLIMMFLVVGVAVPTPAGVGSFHYMYKLAVTRFFGAPADEAVAAAIVLHAVSFVPISILGLIFMAQDGLSFARLRSLAPVAEAAEAQPVAASEGGQP